MRTKLGAGPGDDPVALAPRPTLAAASRSAWLVALLCFTTVVHAEVPAGADSARAPTPTERVRDIVRRDLHQLTSNQTLMIVTTGGAAAAACTAFEDPDRVAAALDGPGWERVANVGNAWGNGLVQAAGAGALLAAGRISDDSNLSLAGMEVGRSLVYDGVLVSLLKVAFDRTRPDGTPYSFPSGHCAVAFAVAPVFTERFGWRVGLPAYVLATATAIGRLEDRKHYLSDDVFGAALGLAVGTAVIVSDRTVGGARVGLGAHGLELTVRY